MTTSSEQYVSAWERRRRDSFAKAAAMFPLANEFGLSRIVQEMWDSAACLNCDGKSCERKLATRCKTQMISVSEDGNVYVLYNPCKYSKVPQGKLSADTKRFLEHQEAIRRDKLKQRHA